MDTFWMIVTDRNKGRPYYIRHAEFATEADAQKAAEHLARQTTEPVYILKTIGSVAMPLEPRYEAADLRAGEACP